MLYVLMPWRQGWLLACAVIVHEGCSDPRWPQLCEWNNLQANRVCMWWQVGGLYCVGCLHVVRGLPATV